MATVTLHNPIHRACAALHRSCSGTNFSAAFQVITLSHDKYEASIDKIQESYRKSRGVANKLRLEVTCLLTIGCGVSGRTAMN